MASDQDKPLIRGDSQTAGHPSYGEAATQEKTGQASQNQARIVSLVGKVVFEYNDFIERIEKFPEKYDLANCTPEDGIRKAARYIIDTIIKISKAISGKKKWYQKLLRKQSLYEYIQEQQASADSSQATK